MSSSGRVYKETKQLELFASYTAFSISRAVTKQLKVVLIRLPNGKMSFNSTVKFLTVKISQRPFEERALFSAANLNNRFKTSGFNINFSLRSVFLDFH